MKFGTESINGKIAGRWGKIILLGLALLGTTAEVRAAGSLVREKAVLKPESRLWIEGTSTLHAWRSAATVVSVELWMERPETEEWRKSLQTGKAKSLTVTALVEGLKSGKTAMDKNAYKALNPKDHPEIKYTMDSYSVSPSTVPGAAEIAVKGRLSIAGTEKPVELSARAVEEKEIWRVRGSRAILMSDFGVAPPRLMMGALKVGDLVDVEYDLVFGEPEKK